MIVYFQDKHQNYLRLGEAKTKREVNKLISNHLNSHNYKSHYSRWWREFNGDWICDVGSWSEFYVVKGADEHFLERE